jgi:hypothetical protein
VGHGVRQVRVLGEHRGAVAGGIQQVALVGRRQKRGAHVGTEGIEDVEPRAVTQLEIEQSGVECVAGPRHPFGPGGRLGDRRATSFELAPRRQAGHRGVVDDQDSHATNGTT